MEKSNLHGIVLHQRVNLIFVYTDGKKRVALDSPDFAYASRMLECVTPWICGVFVNSKQQTGWINRNPVFYPPKQQAKKPVGVPEGVWYSGHKNNGVAPHRAEYKRRLQGILKKAQEFVTLGIDKKAALIAARKCSCQVH
jgi:hypothetical protein